MEFIFDITTSEESNRSEAKVFPSVPAAKRYASTRLASEGSVTLCVMEGDRRKTIATRRMSRTYDGALVMNPWVNF